MILFLHQLFTLIFQNQQKLENHKQNDNDNVIADNFNLLEVLIQLCGSKNLEEIVEICSTAFTMIYPQCNNIQCLRYKIQENRKTWINFYTSEEACINGQRFPDAVNFKVSSGTYSKTIFLRNGKTKEDFCNAVLIYVDGSDQLPDNSLMFVILGKEKTCSSNQSHVLTIIQHASTCLSRLPAQQIELNTEVSALLLSEELSNAANATAMQMYLNQFLSGKTLCSECCILLISEETKQIVCQVVGKRKLNFEICCPVNTSLFRNVCENKTYCLIHDPTPGEKFEIESLFGLTVESILYVPVLDKTTRDTVGIVCLFNKSNNLQFSLSDIKAVHDTMSRCWPVLSTSLMLEQERKAKNECEAMLQIARNLFTHLDDVGMLLGEIIQEARNLTNAERCSVFLVDYQSKELVAKVFDGIVTVDENMNEVRIPLSQGIAGHVATTGKTLNITDAYSHPLFYRGIDATTGFKTRNILCFPIKDHNGVVVGVSQLCNKIKGPCFTSYDEELAEKFSVFSGISISHSLLYKEVEESDARSRLANELMTYHMNVEQSDIVANIPPTKPFPAMFHAQFDQFIYPPRLLENEKKIKACICMYIDLGLTSKFHIHTRSLVHFLLMVRKGYRDPPYHNWDHAFSVMHHGYLLAKHLQLNEKLSDLEVLAFLTACVCHDLDHRGTNNAFQVSSHSVLASLYSSEGSVLERHHFAQAVCILSTPGCNIFENLSRKDYSRTLDLVKQIILATDVASHLQIIPEIEQLVETGVNWSDTRHRELVVALCMTASDLSDQTKDWKTTKNTSKLVYKEFFSQGDMEKRMGNRPAIINDRERACVPQLQINFMEHIALPVYRLLSALFPSYLPVYECVSSNIEKWRKVEREFRSRGLPNNDSLDFLTDEFDRELFNDPSISL